MPSRARPQLQHFSISAWRHGASLACLGIAALALAAAPGAAEARAARRAGHQVSQPARPVLPASVAAALARARIPVSSLGIVVQRIDAPDKPVLALNDARPMHPASTMKLVTTFAGLSLLGPDYRWRTDAYAQGQVANGVLHGQLYLRGTGDPKLVPEELIDLVERIRAQGITSIDGDIVLDKSAFAPSTADAAPLDANSDAPYNVGPDALLYAFKSLTFTFSPGDRGAVDIEVTPALAHLRLDNQLTLVDAPCHGLPAAARPVFSRTPDGALAAAFSGHYPAACGQQSTSVAVLDHSTFFADGFLALWQQAGGAFSGHVREGTVPAGLAPLATHRSPVLADVVQDINKFSNNVMARNLFLTIGAESARLRRTPGDTALSARTIRNWLARSNLDMPELLLENGSGLSRIEAIAPASLAALLRAANASPVAQVFVASLPIVGVDGTMQHRLSNSPVAGNGHIKTGTLNDVRAIAGYLASADGNSYVVVAFVNDPRAEAARPALDALLEWVYRGARP
jgi:D-alanyl-D-alanine carboxypeptidase/D-alanyl-D-alanine-endopeptidase (penicillin-binding protein 4)